MPTSNVWIILFSFRVYTNLDPVIIFHFQAMIVLELLSKGNLRDVLLQLKA